MIILITNKSIPELEKEMPIVNKYPPKGIIPTERKKVGQCDYSVLGTIKLILQQFIHIPFIN